MIYDGACDFCVRWIGRWRRIAGEAIEYLPAREVGDRFPEVPAGQYDEAVHLVEPDGRVSRGAEAAARSLSCGRGLRWPLWIYLRVPGAARITEAVYRFIARRRHCRTNARETSRSER
jgi:predicted DCC family thiol-disulfide oxidoreductase YuxK